MNYKANDMEKFSQAATISGDIGIWRQYSILNKQYMSLEMNDIKERFVDIKMRQNESEIFNFLKDNSKNIEVVDSPPTYKDFKQIYNFLISKKAKRFSMFNKEFKRDGSISHLESIEPCFLAFGHTDLFYDIANIKSFAHVFNYDHGFKFECERGILFDFNIKFILSPLLNSDMVTENIKDSIYSIIIVSRDSYGTILGGDKYKILNQDWIYRLDCKVSDLSEYKDTSAFSHVCADAEGHV